MRVTRYLYEWLEDHVSHPYPTPHQLEILAKGCGLTVEQVNNWMTNIRKRKKGAVLKNNKRTLGYFEYLFLAADYDRRKRQEQNAHFRSTHTTPLPAGCPNGTDYSHVVAHQYAAALNDVHSAHNTSFQHSASDSKQPFTSDWDMMSTNEVGMSNSRYASNPAMSSAHQVHFRAVHCRTVTPPKEDFPLDITTMFATDAFPFQMTNVEMAPGKWASKSVDMGKSDDDDRLMEAFAEIWLPTQEILHVEDSIVDTAAQEHGTGTTENCLETIILNAVDVDAGTSEAANADDTNSIGTNVDSLLGSLGDPLEFEDLDQFSDLEE
jgi:hypothetical protein